MIKKLKEKNNLFNNNILYNNLHSFKENVKNNNLKYNNCNKNFYNNFIIREDIELLNKSIELLFKRNVDKTNKLYNINIKSPSIINMSKNNCYNKLIKNYNIDYNKVKLNTNNVSVNNKINCIYNKKYTKEINYIPNYSLNFGNNFNNKYTSIS